VQQEEPRKLHVRRMNTMTASSRSEHNQTPVWQSNARGIKRSRHQWGSAAPVKRAAAWRCRLTCDAFPQLLVGDQQLADEAEKPRVFGLQLFEASLFGDAERGR
jgi:hypothetical protein